MTAPETADRPFVVFKFGGSSVGAPDRLARIVDVVRRARQGHAVACVVSALSHSTDLLIAAARNAAEGRLDLALENAQSIHDLAWDRAQGRLASEAEAEALKTKLSALHDKLARLLEGISLVEQSSPQSLDHVLSFGERMSVEVVAATLRGVDLPAVAVDAREWTVTDDTFGFAAVDWAATENRVRELRDEWAGSITVHTGFLGKDESGRTTTLGRNGSDYTATLLGRALGAESVQIWTDTPGVMTADPKIVSEAYPVRHLSYMEALELANFGARMFHTRTMIPLIESGIPLTIRNLLDDSDPGTRVDEHGSTDPDRPTSVASLQGVALIEVDSKRVASELEVGNRVLSAMRDASIQVWLATQSGHGQALAVVVPGPDRERAQNVLQTEFAEELARTEVEGIRARYPVTLVTLVAETMGQSVNVAGRLFAALGRIGVGVWAIAQSGSARSIACAVDAADTEVAVRTVHAAFNLASEPIHVAVLGAGVVGSELLEQIRGQRAELTQTMGVDLRVVGLSTSKRAAYDEAGLDLDDWRGVLDAAGPRDADPTVLLDRLQRLAVPILVDCTAADDMEAVYHQAFERGIHVVAANKKPLTIAGEDRDALLAAAKAKYRTYNYETTVGASLPVIDTLQNLVRTGDKVRRVEGSLSGTLGYLTNVLMEGVPLSQAVKDAKRLGYTEPHPRDDLSGTDAARKALILARELGLRMDFDAVKVEPLVPQEILQEADLDRFFAALEAYDATFAEKIEAMKAEGQVLRYLATVDPAATPALSVGPTAVPADHPATRLRGTEGFVAFFSERYSEFPLVVQGAGAGGAVTAAGVLADVLRIAQTMRGQ